MKFRIWNKIDKKFYTYNNLDTIKWLIDMNGNLGYMDLNDFSWSGLLPKGFYELNQYVCKDMNGKDIYEGDILKDKYGTKGLIINDNYGFKIKIKELTNAFPIGSVEFKGLALSGNKYENTIDFWED